MSFFGMMNDLFLFIFFSIENIIRISHVYTVPKMGITVPADVLARISARSSAGTVLTTKYFFSFNSFL